MIQTPVTALLCLFKTLLCLLLYSVSQLSAQQTDGQANRAANPIVFRAVNVFDGENLVRATSVLIEDGVIKSVGKEIVEPESAEVIDGAGMTLMPGMIDCHTHTFFEGQLKQAAEFGVTTELDMMSVPMVAARMRGTQQAGKANDRADYFSAGAAVTVEGGHGTQFGFKVPTLATAGEAPQFIEERIREGSDYIKIIHEPGTAFGLERPTLSAEMLKAAIEAAKAKDKLAVAHIGGNAGASMAVEFGIDGLVHLQADEKISDELLKQMLEGNVFVVPTTAVIQNMTGPVTVDSLIDDPNIGPLLNQLDLQGLGRNFPIQEGALNKTENLYYNIAALEKAGIPVLAGTDSPNPGTTHGASMHHELELLVAAGLTAEQALAAATSRPADCFRLDNRGRVKPGMRADLLLVQGDPTQDIKATRNIVGVWKGGFRIDREKRRETIQKSREKTKADKKESNQTKDK